MRIIISSKFSFCDLIDLVNSLSMIHNIQLIINEFYNFWEIEQ